MPVSQAFVDRVTETIGAVRPIRVAKMFGGIAVYHDEVFFGLGDDDRLYFKVDAATAPAYDAKGMGPWVFNGKPVDKYRELPSDVFENPDQLGEWVDEAVRVARELKAAQKPARKKRKPS
ncbi:MAG: TfoX/Sxy family protein [Fimbriimonas sp.]